MKEETRALNAGCMINQYIPVTFEELMRNNQWFREEEAYAEDMRL